MLIQAMTTEAILRALADPTRMRMMRLVQRMELSVGELAQVLGQSQPRVSQHVAKLVDSGLMHRHREGSWVFVRCATRTGGSPLLDAAARLLATAENEDAAFGQQCRSDRERLATIRAAREAGAQDYFARNAEEWDAMRAMLGPGDPVETAILAALKSHAIGQAIDIGTGTGRIAEVLVRHSDHLVAIDKSPDMLRLARAKLQHIEESIELVQADFTALPFPAASFDTVVFHQVLHHAGDLALPLAEAARICRPGGRIVIADLAKHDREELRTRHAHARLGFANDAMHAALEAAGFAPDTPVELTGSELTTVVWTATRIEPPARTIAR